MEAPTLTNYAACKIIQKPSDIIERLWHRDRASTFGFFQNTKGLTVMRRRNKISQRILLATTAPYCTKTQ